MNLRKNLEASFYYPNVRSAVKPGTLVMIAFGDVRVGPVIAL